MIKKEIRPNGTVRVWTEFDPSEIEEEDCKQAVQDQRDDCDVNIILARAMRNNGMINPASLNKKTGVYGDFSKNIDYQGAMDTVINLNEQFNQLPARVREKFQNDPQQLINYLGDKDKLEESYSLGLRVRPEKKPVDPVVAGLDELKKSVDENTATIKGKK